ncbi:hypothetical protein ABIA30_004839 [Mycobacterium sp. MAA66]
MPIPPSTTHPGGCLNHLGDPPLRLIPQPHLAFFEALALAAASASPSRVWAALLAFALFHLSDLAVAMAQVARGLTDGGRVGALR